MYAEHSLSATIHRMVEAVQPCAEQLIAEAAAVLAADRHGEALQLHLGNAEQLIRAMLTHGRERQDPVRTLTACMGDRWTPLIMNLLNGGVLRFGELRRLVRIISVEGDISQHVLTLKLRLLERDGLVSRTVSGSETLTRTEYSLTPLGHGAYEQYQSMMRWAEQATPLIRAARQSYEAAHGRAEDGSAEASA
jgi:DNA-binding HxlR family transcriptional regulator